MSGKTAKHSGEQLKRRQAFQRLKQDLQFASFVSQTAQAHETPPPYPSPAAVAAQEPLMAETSSQPSAPDFHDESWPPVDATEAMEATGATEPAEARPTELPAPTSAPAPTPAPANHGVAFSLREPMTCELCRQKVTKWLSYKPDEGTCLCWDCGLAKMDRIMKGQKVP
jgi:hypothetical protein